MEISVLASGSSGNSFFCQANGSAFLIDAGISCRQTRERLAHLGKDIRKISAVFVTHEHIDHVRGLTTLTNKYNLPVYLTKGCYNQVCHMVDKEMVNMVKPGRSIDFNGCTVEPFSKSHDAKDPVSYTIRYKKKTISVITDIGFVCRNTERAVKESDILILESNHDSTMLQTGPYPHFLKNRISGKQGHISNYEAALAVLGHSPSTLHHVFLAHLSLVNNTGQKALSTFSIVKERKDLWNLKVSLTYPHKPTHLLRV